MTHKAPFHTAWPRDHRNNWKCRRARLIARKNSRVVAVLGGVVKGRSVMPD